MGILVTTMVKLKKSELLKIIKEEVEAALEEASYPEGFDLEAFKALPSFKARQEYVKQRLPRIAAGSARVVFIVDDKTVLKVAINNKGLAQNRVEAEVGRRSVMYPVAEVFASGDNGAWLEMERAVKAKPSDFKRLAGLDIQTFDRVIRFWKASQSGGRYQFKPEGYEEYIESGNYPVVEAAIDLMVDYDMLPGDMGRISSWGVVNRDKPELVLIDFGLTATVHGDYYAKKKIQSNYTPPPEGYYPWGEKMK